LCFGLQFHYQFHRKKGLTQSRKIAKNFFKKSMNEQFKNPIRYYAQGRPFIFFMIKYLFLRLSVFA